LLTHPCRSKKIKAPPKETAYYRLPSKPRIAQIYNAAPVIAMFAPDMFKKINPSASSAAIEI